MIKSQTGFYDLNVPEYCLDVQYRKRTLESLLNLGYRTIAINQELDVNSNIAPNKKKKKGEPRDDPETVPNPIDLKEFENIAKQLKFDNITFLNRLTLVFSEQDSVQKYIKSTNYKKYDIIAVIPSTMKALSYVASSLDADILSFDPHSKFSLRLNRKMYMQLVEKGYHFELTYSPAIQDSTKRKNLIHLSHLYHTFGKSRNIIISSGADNPMLFRGPYDIINLGFLFGLNELQSKNAVLHCGRKVILNAFGRKHGKALMVVENMDVFEQIESAEEDMDTDEPMHKKSKQ